MEFKDQKTIFEKIVPLSFGNIGYCVRHFNWTNKPTEKNLRGKNVVITGATSGLGLHLAHKLNKAQANIILVGRNESALKKIIEKLIKQNDDQKYNYFICDFSKLNSVLDLAKQIEKKYSQIDILIHNAGAMHKERQLSVEGLEKTFVLHALSPFLLNHLLTPLLKNSKEARVIHISSGGMYTTPVDLKDIGFKKQTYSDLKAYAHAKRVQVILAELFADFWKNENIKSFSMHPGWVKTPGLKSAMTGFYVLTYPLLRTLSQGTDTIEWLCLEKSESLTNGGFYFDRKIQSIDWTEKTVLSEEEKKSIWTFCSEALNKIYQS